MSSVRSWRHSLYARALLFTLIGSGSLLGAVVVQSYVMVNTSVDRLLGERIELARATGNYLEYLLHQDLDRIGGVISDPLTKAADPSDDRKALRAALAEARSGSVFEEGLFAVGADGRILTGVPDTPYELSRLLDMHAMLKEARTNDGPVTSPLVHLSLGNRPVLVVLVAVRAAGGALIGYAGGLLHPASTSLLKPFEARTAVTGSTASLQLVDQNGTLVASTRSEELFQATDHGRLITEAIRNRTVVQGRCHACHLEGNAPVTRKVEVLAFAPLPHLKLGMAVRQLEGEALAPAFTLQKRLALLGSSFVVLFVFFTGLSVRSVVKPLRRLTKAVRGIELSGMGSPLPSFGQDEIGALAKALDRWRGRVVLSLAESESHQAALHHEVETTLKHLAALQSIAEFGLQNSDLDAIVQDSLRKLVEFFALPCGAFRLTHGARVVNASLNLSDVQARTLLEMNASLPAARGEAPDASEKYWVRKLDATKPEALAVAGVLGTVLFAGLALPQGFKVLCVLGDASRRALTVDERHLQSFLHQIIMSAANRLLHEQDALRHRQSQHFLHRVLSAQEEERRRIARELHDTIAQDLAAQRLQIERLAAKNADPALAEKITTLESQAHRMLVTLRQLLVDLRPSVLDEMGFLPALQWYLERVERDHRIHGTLSIEGEQTTLRHELTMTLFRIFQECLNNIVNHSGAEQVLVTVTFANAHVELAIEDDGRGFDPAELDMRRPSQEGRGLGVLGMIERSKLLGGTLKIDSAVGNGTTITVQLPLELKEVPT